LTIDAKEKSFKLLEGYSKYLLNGESDDLYEAINQRTDNLVKLGWVDNKEISELHLRILELINKIESINMHSIDTTQIINSISIDEQFKSALLVDEITKSWKI
jgi:tRNA A37 N6-isopentenylltransferase MiaA